MKKILFAVMFLAVTAGAQIPAGFVQTTATVTKLANGTFGASWTSLSSSSQLPLLGGQSSFQQTVNGNFDSSGHFSILLADTSQIIPSPSTWTFQINFACPSGAPPINSGFTVQVAVTGGGGTEDISSYITAALPTNPCGGVSAAGVSQIIAGTNVTISPPGGTGIVTVNSSGSGLPLTGGTLTGALYGTSDFMTSAGVPSDSTDGIGLMYQSGYGYLKVGTADGIYFASGNNNISGYPTYFLGNFDQYGDFTATGDVTAGAANTTLASAQQGAVTNNGVNLGYADTGLTDTRVYTINGYAQEIVKNASTGASASVDLITNNSASTASNYFGDYGQNGTGFSGSGANLTGLAGEVYLYSMGEPLGIGTASANNVYFDYNLTDYMEFTSNGVIFPQITTTPSTSPLCLDGTGGALTITGCSGGGGLSGMTAGQVPIAATPTTVTSSKALAGAGTGITTGPTTSTNGDCVSFNGTSGQIQDSGAGCGGAPTFTSITGGTNTSAAMVVGAGASLDYTSTGTIDANKLMTYAIPTLASGYLQWNGSAFVWNTPAGAGTVTDGSGVTTAGYIPVSTTSAHTLTYTPTSTYNLSVPTLTAFDTVATLGVANTFSKKLTTVASATASAGLNIPPGAAPTTPASGDCWTTTTTSTLWNCYLGSTTYSFGALAVANSWSSAQTFAGWTSSANNTISNSPAVSQYALKMSGAVQTGGTATTNFPYFGMVPGATARTDWSTGGTFIGINAASGFAGDFFSAEINNSGTPFRVTSAGAVVAPGGLGTQVHAFGIVDMSNTVYTASQVVGYFQSPVAGTIPSGGSGTYNNVTGTLECSLQTATTSSTTFTLYYASSITGSFTSFGTIVFSASSQVSPTVTISSSQSVALGGVVRISGPASADATAAGLVCSIPFIY